MRYKWSHVSFRISFICGPAAKKVHPPIIQVVVGRQDLSCHKIFSTLPFSTNTQVELKKVKYDKITNLLLRFVEN